MRRFSIRKAMLLIALVAGNFAAVRYLDPLPVSPGILPLLLAGLLPLVDAQLIGLYWIASRYRFALRRRVGTGYGIGVLVFGVLNAAVLTTLIAACLAAPDHVAAAVFYPIQPIGKWFLAIGYKEQDFDRPFFRFLVIPALVGIVMSGPALVLGLAVARLADRFELVITRRSSIPGYERTI